jgi:hypothetical protein
MEESAMLSRYAHLSPTHLWNEVEGLPAFTGQISGETVTGGSKKEPEAVQPIDFSGEPRAAQTHDPRLKRANLDDYPRE